MLQRLRPRLWPALSRSKDLDWICKTLSDAQFARSVNYERDDEARVKDARCARAGSAGASHP
jgi:hypothetical protein